jgi:hypothetical protein
VPLGFQLADAAQIGLAALRELSLRPRSSPRHSPEYLPEAALARLGADAEPHDAVTLAVIEPIRQLVAAAAAP